MPVLTNVDKRYTYDVKKKLRKDEVRLIDELKELLEKSPEDMNDEEWEAVKWLVMYFNDLMFAVRANHKILEAERRIGKI